MPLNLLQAATANEVSSLKLLFPVLAQALGSKTPDVDFDGFTKTVKKLELKYMYWTNVNKGFAILNAIHPEIITGLKEGKNIEINLKESEENKLQEAISLLRPHDLVDSRRTGNTSLSSNGTFYGFNIIAISNLEPVFKDPECKW